MTDEEIRKLAREYDVDEWRPIDGFPLYYISPCGQVLSLKQSKPRILRPVVNTDGYKAVGLTRGDGLHTTAKIHRLVAGAYIPNPYKFPCVNHKDENKQNNNVTNLEWCSHKYNNSYGTKPMRISQKMTNNPKISTPVGAYNQYGELIAIFPSAMEAARVLKFANSAISATVKGQRSHHHSLEWREIELDKTIRNLFGSELFNDTEK